MAVQQGRPLTVELVARRNLGTSPGGTRLVGSLQYVELDRERINAIPAEVRAAVIIQAVFQSHMRAPSRPTCTCQGKLIVPL